MKMFALLTRKKREIYCKRCDNANRSDAAKMQAPRAFNAWIRGRNMKANALKVKGRGKRLNANNTQRQRKRN